MISRKEHRQLFEDVLKNSPEDFSNAQSLLIIATPRCGSTLFCDVLNNTGKLGLCDEWINIEYFQAYCDVLGKPFEEFKISEYLTEIISKTLRGTDVFTIKAHVGQLDVLAKDFGIVNMSFTHSIYLHRRNKIEQAVSYAKAKKTNKWRFDQEAYETEFTLTNDEVVEALKELVNSESVYETNYEPSVCASFAYEDFSNLCYWGYNYVLELFGKPAELSNSFKTAMKVQRGTKSEGYARSFRLYITGECS